MGCSDSQIPERLWGVVLSEADLDVWGEGRDMAHPIQPGRWKGRRIEIEYYIPDADAFDSALQEDEDRAYLEAVESICYVPDENAWAFEAKARNCGNSIAVTVPAQAVRFLGISEGDRVSVVVEKIE